MTAETTMSDEIAADLMALQFKYGKDHLDWAGILLGGGTHICEIHGMSREEFLKMMDVNFKEQRRTRIKNHEGKAVNNNEKR